MSCSTSITLPTGPPGSATNGSNGNHGGISGRWVFSTSTSTSPSSTQLRFDNTASNLVSNIYISDTGVGSVDYDLLLDSFNNSGNYGTITIFKEFDSTKFWIGKITSVTDNGSDHTIGVTYITSSNATIPTNIYSNGDGLAVIFSASGSSGTNGTNGTNGTTVLYNDTTASGTSSGALANLKSYTLPSSNSTPSGKTLVNAGDMIELSTYVTQSGTLQYTFSLYVNTTVLSTYTDTNNYKYGSFVIRITRITSTTVLVESTTRQMFNNGIVSNSKKTSSVVTVNDLDTLSNIFYIKGSSTAPTTVLANNLTVLLYKI